MRVRGASPWQAAAVACLLARVVDASLGDRLPDFKDCVQVGSSRCSASFLVLIIFCRSALKQTAARTRRPYVCAFLYMYQAHCQLIAASFPPPRPLVGLPLRVRLHLSACNHRQAPRTRSSVHAADISVPREMALLPLPRYAGALLCDILPFQLPRTRLGHVAAP